MRPARATTRSPIAEDYQGAIAVTADRELAERVRGADADVVGPCWLLDQLAD